ncbi:hypothetical protein Taro_034129 [Colocasia esculenta]|uniref:Uncharacterized protein n=1 Tax=Colocasia esculenta TaxID=4460 RepID=A0A843VX07_COLES|nr:hypothetical protein [Colocasia esculenta]
MEMRWEKLLVTARARETPEGRRTAGRKGGVFGPGRRWGHTCNVVRHGRLIYAFGGYGEDNCQTNDVHVFDTVKKTWSKPMMKGVPPIPRDSHTCTTVGSKLFVFGGTDGKNPLRDLHVLDTSTNTWTLPVIHGEGPDAREGHGAALVGTKLFIFGDNFVWERSVTSGTPPCARDSHTCSSWGNKLIVLGGEDASDRYLSDVYMLDTETLVWKELNTSGQMLTPRAGHSTVVLGNNLLVYGGFTNHRNLFGDLYVLNIGIKLGNDEGDGKQENISLGKELKRKCQESRCENESDALQTGTLLCNPNPSEERTFEARVVDRISNGSIVEYTVETSIDGHLLRGVLFSTSNTYSNSGRHYANKNKRRMGKDNDARLNGEYQERLIGANATHQAMRNAHPRITDQCQTGASTTVQSDREPLDLSSLNMVPVTHFMYSNAMSMAGHQNAMNMVPHPNSMSMVPRPDSMTMAPRPNSMSLVPHPNSMSVIPAYAVAQPERGLEPDPSSIQEEVHLKDEHHGYPNVLMREEVACEEPAAAEETLPKPPNEG